MFSALRREHIKKWGTNAYVVKRYQKRLEQEGDGIVDCRYTLRDGSGWTLIDGCRGRPSQIESKA